MRRLATLVQMALWVAGVCGAGCKHKSKVPAEVYFVAEGTGVQLPKLPGWVRDSSVPPLDKSKGGIVLRLIRDSAVPGSPRIEVVTEPPQAAATNLEDYLTRNLREMADLETSGRIRILSVSQKHVMLHGLPAYEVHHEYTMGRGTSQISLNQVSIFVALNGRGITVTAAGRTELFHPLSDNVEQILEGLSVPEPSAPTTHEDIPQLDLGKVGGTTGAPSP